MDQNKVIKTIKVEIDLKITHRDIRDIMHTLLCDKNSFYKIFLDENDVGRHLTKKNFSEYITKRLINGDSIYFSNTKKDSDDVWELNLEKLSNGIKKTFLKYDSYLIIGSRLNLGVVTTRLANIIMYYSLSE